MRHAPEWIPFNSTALTRPLDMQQLAIFARQHGVTNTSVMWVHTGFIAAAMFFIAPMIAALLSMLTLGSAAVIGVFIVLLMGAGYIAVWVVVAKAVSKKASKNQEAWFRLSQFAPENGMTYYPRIDAPMLPGIAFRGQRAPRSENVVRGVAPRMVEVGNFKYEVDTGKSTRTVTTGYVAIRVDNLLPNIILDARGNGSLGAIKADQHLSLEGDFDNYFKLYCPTGYEVDALYLFTPDLMERMIVQAGALDVELVDNWVFFYAPGRELTTIDPATWAWLFSLIHAMLTKLGQWERWRDDRMAALRASSGLPPVLPVGTPVPQFAGTPSHALSATPADATIPYVQPQNVIPPLSLVPQAPGVAPQGRRLRTGVPVWGIILIILGALVLLALPVMFFLAVLMPAATSGATAAAAAGVLLL